jgi:aryl-phospho-beta-D-glucosidase BglC (GH1 family)
VLADFEGGQALNADTQQCETDIVPNGGGNGLQIVTEAGALWPGVFIKPREGTWDVSQYDCAEMDVYNPQDVPVRVLLSLNNPGADGQRHCNTESVTVPPRQRAKLVLPFGMWHGNPDHPLDLTNIVSVHVLLDRPTRSHRFVIDNIRAVKFDRRQMDAIFADPFFAQLKPVFGRGVNLGNALDAPREGEWGVTLEEGYFDLIRKAGFDSVRIPVRWSAHADAAAPFRIDPKFFERVDWAIQQSLARGLQPLVNMHHYGEMMTDPDAHRERFLALWRQIAEHYRDLPPSVAFELLNEPTGKLTAQKWNEILAEALRVVRRTHPDRQIVIGPVGWNAIGELGGLVLPEDDRHLIVTVHYYSPFQFTHQGADWAGSEAAKWLGTKWTGTKAEQQGVIRDLDTAITWAVKHHRPLYLGEFGAYSRADMESRARWTRFVADEALKRKAGFAYWEFCSGFGVYDAQRKQWNEPLKNALVPSGGTK